jgi:hypothetical protein
MGRSRRGRLREERVQPARLLAWHAAVAEENVVEEEHVAL